MSSPYADLDRPPLSERALRRALLHEGSVWTDLRVVASTGSTNADVAAAAQQGVPQGLVEIAESQTAGRGRLDRQWTSPPRAGLTFSVLLRPTTARQTWSWLPLLAGLAVRRAVVAVTEVEPDLKWPNDLLVGGRKLAGLLAEVHGDAVVLGVGLNVSTRAEELLPTAASLATAGAEVLDRDTLLRAILRELGSGYDAWTLRSGGAEQIRDEYVRHCRTVGSALRVALAGGGVVEGTGVDVDGEGRLVVRLADGSQQTLSSGDVEHVRPADSGEVRG